MSAVLWYMRHHFMEHQLCDDLEEALKAGYFLEDNGEGSVSCVQYNEGQSIMSQDEFRQWCLDYENQPQDEVARKPLIGTITVIAPNGQTDSVAYSDQESLDKDLVAYAEALGIENVYFSHILNQEG